MKGVCILTAIVLLAAAPILLLSAEDGAALYDSNCSMCHGAKGEGVPDAIPALKGTALTAEQIVALLIKGDAAKSTHANPIGNLNESQAKAIAAHVKAMK